VPRLSQHAAAAAPDDDDVLVKLAAGWAKSSEFA